MKRLLGALLGVLTAFGGFVDIGELVVNALVGGRFGMSLAWVVVVGVIGICLFAEMAGRVAAVANRPVYDVVRERLGPRLALGNLVASFLVTLLTLAAEVGGVAVALYLATSVHYLLWIPVVAVLVWLVIWRMRFETMEKVFGLTGLALIVFAVALWKLVPDWSTLLDQATHPSLPAGEGLPTYFYYAIAMFAAALSPHLVFFFSSGGVEERWTVGDLATERLNVYIGFPLGGLLPLSIMTVAAVVYFPLHVDVSDLAYTVLPVALALGKLGLAAALLGIFAVTYGASLETALSCGYAVAQYFGWQWGKRFRPRQAARFHLVVMICIAVAALVVLTGIDPVKVTEYALVFSAVALPLTYLPILVVANDPDYMGEHVNGPVFNVLGAIYLVIIVAAATAAIPLMIATKAGG